MRPLLDVGAIERKVRVLLRFVRDAGLEIRRQLPGRKYQSADRERFGIMRDRPRIFGLDQLAFELARYIADQIDFDLRVLDQQARRSDGCARRRDLEIFLPHLVEGMKVTQVFQEHLRLDDVIERTSRSLEGPREVLHDVMRPPLDVRAIERKVRVLLGFKGNSGLEIGRQLARSEDQSADVEGFGVDRKRLRIIRFDDFCVHLFSLPLALAAIAGLSEWYRPSPSR